MGLVHFPSVQPAIQNRRLHLQHTERIVDWNGTNGDAPDIAFLKIPEIDGRALEAAGAVFYNLASPRAFKPSKPDNRMSLCHAIVGVVGEWTEEVPRQIWGRAEDRHRRGVRGDYRSSRFQRGRKRPRRGDDFARTADFPRAMKG